MLLHTKLNTMAAACALSLIGIPGMSQAEDRRSAEQAGPREDVQEAAKVVQQMKQDSRLSEALSKAKGIFIVPDYATASLIVGGSGGEGVLLGNTSAGSTTGTGVDATADAGMTDDVDTTAGDRDTSYGVDTAEPVAQSARGWSAPVFYDIGSISVGAQAGAAGGSLAMLLMNDEAVASFHSENNFSLNAEAGLTVVNWSPEAEASWGKGDVVVWSDTEGLLGKASLAVEDIHWDEEETRQYYDDESATPRESLAGNVQNPHDTDLQSDLAELTGS